MKGEAKLTKFRYSDRGYEYRTGVRKTEKGKEVRGKVCGKGQMERRGNVVMNMVVDEGDGR